MAKTTTARVDQSSVPASDEPKYRFNLAKWIIFFVFTVTGVIGLAAIAMATVFYDEKSFGSVKDILGILLPVLSAWAGTVIAFYFGRENFEAGTQSSAALVRHFTSEEKLKSITLKEVMIDISTAVTFKLAKPEKDIKLKSDLIDAKLEKENKERLPILDPQGCIKYMAHRSLIDKFIAQEAIKGRKVDDLTLQDMLNDGKFNNVLTGSFRALPETHNLAQVKFLMDQIKILSDVFITEDGTANSKVLGWVTNVIVAEQSKL
ncbi:MAG: hypothetical protein JSW66_09825 [Phycisphaerales bacterium]|nr:MAG: hypothetical protein JSW66_09825 [Phycisphaerales bacterium]